MLNLPLLCKIIENSFKQLNSSQNAYCFDIFQLWFRPHHSTETALAKVTNDIQNTDNGNVLVFVLLDLSAAFDTINHNLLLNRLKNWFQSYLKDIMYFVSIGIDTSSGQRLHVDFSRVQLWGLFYPLFTYSDLTPYVINILQMTHKSM